MELIHLLDRSTPPFSAPQPRYRAGHTQGVLPWVRSIWHDGKKVTLHAVVCGAWVYPWNAATSASDVTCESCKEEAANLAVCELKDRVKK